MCAYSLYKSAKFEIFMFYRFREKRLDRTGHTIGVIMNPFSLFNYEAIKNDFAKIFLKN